MRASTGSTLVIVFARAPVAGHAKTRLIPRLGAWGAAALQRRMTLRAVRVAASVFPVEIHGTARHGLFRTLREKFVLQRGRDLGERMHHAMAKGLRRHRAVIIVGTDCPVLGARDLRRAARLLHGNDAVFAPAEDGGYALVGMAKARRAVFAGVRWGTASVWSETVARLERAGLRWKALRTVWDVDRPADLDRLRSLRSCAGSRPPARR